THAPVMMELRVRACHVQGQFKTKDNVAPPVSTRNKLPEPAPFDYGRLAHPPVSFAQERLKVEERLPIAHEFILGEELNEVLDGDVKGVGIILQGGLHNTLARRRSAVGLGDAFGSSRIPLLVLNVVHPLVPEQITEFCADKRDVLVLEEGNPEFIEHQVNVILRKADIGTRVHGKGVVPHAGEYTAAVVQHGLT